MKLRDVTSEVAAGVSPAARMEDIYMSSFPPDERRDFSSVRALCAAADVYKVYAIETDTGEMAGFVTLWRFDGFDYIEHFAVDAALRGGGYGRQALRQLLVAVCRGRTVVLEVEPAETDAIAPRRIAFYRRCGFTDYPEFTYIQPPYSPEKSEVPLVLMASAEGLAHGQLETIAQTLHRRVYGAV